MSDRGAYIWKIILIKVSRLCRFRIIFLSFCTELKSSTWGGGAKTFCRFVSIIYRFTYSRNGSLFKVWFNGTRECNCMMYDVIAMRLLHRGDGGVAFDYPNQHMLITFGTRFGQVTNAPVEREHDQNRGQTSLASARRLRGEDHANDSHASGPRWGSSALQLPGTWGRGIGRPGWGRHSPNTLGETRIWGA